MRRNILKIRDNYKEFRKFQSIQNFLDPSYQQINVARLQHLDSLGLDLSRKSVIEFGAGIGDHTLFYLYRNCSVLPTEGRAELVDYIIRRFGIKAIQFDIETDLNKLNALPHADFIHCYGVLYHINNPAEFLQAVGGVGTTILLETCVSADQYAASHNPVFEDQANPTQALSGKGCRPGRRWIFDKLKDTYEYVYMPRTQPDHKQFPKNWSTLIDDPAELYRAVFIASHIPLRLPLLSETFVSTYD